MLVLCGTYILLACPYKCHACVASCKYILPVGRYSAVAAGAALGGQDGRVGQRAAAAGQHAHDHARRDRARVGHLPHQTNVLLPRAVSSEVSDVIACMCVYAIVKSEVQCIIEIMLFCCVMVSF